AGEDGHYQLAIHSRPEQAAAEEDAEWTRHAEGTLSSKSLPTPGPLDAWPPQGAEPIETDYLGDLLAERGLELGPAFQGLTAAWKEGERIYAEASLPEEQASQAERFALHPALLDCALHALASGETGAQLELPSAFADAALYGAGAQALRLRLTPGEGGHAIEAYDGDGEPVLTAKLNRAPLELKELQGTRTHRSLHRVQWHPAPQASTNGQRPSLAILGETELAIEAERYRDLDALIEAIEQGAEPPEILLAPIGAGEGQGADLPTAAQANAERALALLQAFAASERLEGSRLTLLTEGAIAAGSGEAPNLTTAPIWGLTRSAASEHPGRFALLDTDGTEASKEALQAALALGAQEPQIALREGASLIPRLARVKASEQEQSPAPLDPERTILITGGLSGLRALVARPRTSQGARQLLLVSRRGSEAKGAKELEAELQELGAEVQIAACDVTEKAALKELFKSIPKEHPRGAIVHSAGAIDDGVLAAM